MSHIKESMCGGTRAISIVYDSIEDYDAESPAQIAKHNSNLYSYYYNMGIGSVWGFRSDMAAGQHVFGAGVRTSKQAMDLCRTGSAQLLEQIKAMWGDERPDLDLASSQVHKRRRKRMRADYGDTLDIHRVWSGQLDKAWERPESINRLSVSKKHATIYLDLAAGCGVSSGEALWRAATTILICEILVRAGRAVEIYVGDSTNGGYEGEGGFLTLGNMRNHNTPYITWTAMRVKGYTEPLNEERLAVMSTMLFYRTFAFYMMMATPYKLRSVGGARNQGMPVQLTERDEAGELVVRIGACTTMEQAEAEFMKVKAQLIREDAPNDRSSTQSMEVY